MFRYQMKTDQHIVIDFFSPYEDRGAVGAEGCGEGSVLYLLRVGPYNIFPLGGVHAAQGFPNVSK